MQLTDELRAMLTRPSLCYVATTMPDGSPQLTQTWVDGDGDQVLINTVEGHQKVRNLRRDPRVSIAVSDPAAPVFYVELRGHVVSITDEGGAEHIDVLARRYTGAPYAWYGGRDQIRLIVRIEVDKINRLGV